MLHALHKLRTDFKNHALLQAYNKKRSYYKTIIRQKKTTYWEEEGKIIEEEA